MSGYIGKLPVPEATQTRDRFVATSGQTTFNTSGYTPNYLDVYQEGVKLDTTEFIATDGSIVELTTGATAGDVIEVIAYTTFSPADAVSASNGGTFNGNVTVNGTLDATAFTQSGAPLESYTKSTSNPAIDTNATLGAMWLNTTTGEVFTCVDATTNNNAWVGQLGSLVNLAYWGEFDFFGDGSSVALYEFNSGALGVDTGGQYSMSTVSGVSNGTGVIGNCYSATGGYMKNGNGMNNTNVISVSVWVKPTNTDHNYIFSSGKKQNGTCWRGMRVSNGQLQFSHASEWSYATTDITSVPINSWTHIVISKDKIYKNGSYVGAMSSYTGPTSTTYGLYIGANGAYDYGYITSETYGQPWDGQIDQLRVFNRELTAEEVTLLYNEPSNV